jgi:hypothetical protein
MNTKKSHSINTTPLVMLLGGWMGNKKQKGAWMLPAWLILHVVNRNATETVVHVSRGLIKHAWLKLHLS